VLRIEIKEEEIRNYHAYYHVIYSALLMVFE
jgi:hypothetical protein